MFLGWEELPSKEKLSKLAPPLLAHRVSGRVVPLMEVQSAERLPFPVVSPPLREQTDLFVYRKSKIPSCAVVVPHFYCELQHFMTISAYDSGTASVTYSKLFEHDGGCFQGEVTANYTCVYSILC